VKAGLLGLALIALAPAAAGQEGVADPREILGPPRSGTLAGPALDARTDEVASLLRCPVCQGLSVADSPSALALNMKAQVKEMCAAGYDREQILAYFERSYGEFVRLEPPRRGVNWVVWLGPLLVFLTGGVFVIRAVRAARKHPPAPGDQTSGAPSSSPARLPEDPTMARYVLQVRELAGGSGHLEPDRAAAASSPGDRRQRS